MNTKKKEWKAPRVWCFGDIEDLTRQAQLDPNCQYRGIRSNPGVYNQYANKAYAIKVPNCVDGVTGGGGS